MSRIEVIVPTMNANMKQLYHRMNIKTDIFIANQTSLYDYEEEIIDGNRVRMLSTATRGVGLNRNLGLQLSQGEILLLADDDNIYFDNYPFIVEKAANELHNADVIIFQLKYVKDGKIISENNYKTERKHFYNGLGYGGSRIAIRKKSLMRANINFTNLFGGGCKFSSGEDSQFLFDCYKKGLKVYTYNETIGINIKDDSSWFTGYNEKFFYDNGSFIASAFNKTLQIPIMLHILNRYKKCGDIALLRKIRLMRAGQKNFKNLLSYEEWIKDTKNKF